MKHTTVIRNCLMPLSRCSESEKNAVQTVLFGTGMNCVLFLFKSHHTKAFGVMKSSVLYLPVNRLPGKVVFLPA